MRLFEERSIRALVIGLLVLAAALAAVVGAPFAHAAEHPAAAAADTDDDDQPLAPPAAGPLVPPPRSIDDITAILDQQKPDPALRQAAEASANATPAADVQGADLAEFYLRRGVAARALGHADQEMADYAKALEVAPGGIASDAGSRAAFQIGFAEVRLGRFADGIAEMRQAIKNVPDEKRGRRVVFSSKLARVLAFAGDLEGAEDAVARAGPLPGGKGGRHGGGGNNPQVRVFVLEAKGAIAQARGDYAEAEGWFRREIAVNDEQDYPGSKFQAALERRFLAQTLIAQGRLLEAEIELRKALLMTLELRGHFSYDTAQCLGGLANLLSDQGRFKEAERIASAALEIYQTGTANDDGLDAVAKMQLTLATALAGQKQPEKALAIYDGIAAKLDRYSPQFRRSFAVFTNYPLALINAGQAAKAVRPLEAAVAQMQPHYRADSPEFADQRGLLALALAGSQQDGRAFELYRQVAPVLMQSHQSADPEGTTGRDRRAVRELSGYIDLLARLRGGALDHQGGVDAVREAFVVAEVARSRSVQRAVADASARAAITDPALADLARQAQDADKEYAATSALLAEVFALPADQQDLSTVANLVRRLDELRKLRDDAGQTMGQKFPRYAQLVRPLPPSVADAQAALHPGEALIAYYVDEKHTLVWAVPPKGEPAFADVPFGRGALEDKVALVRAALDPHGGGLDDIPAFDVATAYELYHLLLEPVKAGWSGASSLLIVPHGALGYLPFGLLPTAPSTMPTDGQPRFSNYRQVPWLIRQAAITVLPSVSTLTLLRALPPASAKRIPFVGFGDPLFKPGDSAPAPAPSDGVTRGLQRRGLPTDIAGGLRGLGSLPRLPDTAVEVRSIAATLHADEAHAVFLQAAASKDQAKQMDLGSVRVVEFATHGLLPGEIDGLTQPALALSSPEVTGNKDDGLLTLSDILAIKLNADWVVLSACNTGAGSGAGAEALSGLARGFFYAGSRAVLVSNWSVYSEAATSLTTEMFRLQAADAKLSRAEALRQSMLSLLDRDGPVDAASGKPRYSFAHPVFWAPFSVVGDGGS